MTIIYLAYLLIPIITLIIFEESLYEFLINLENATATKKLLETVVTNYTIYSISYAFSLIITSIGLITLSRTTNNFADLFLERKPIIYYIIIIYSVSLLLITTSLYVIYKTPILSQLLEHELEKAYNSGKVIDIDLPTLRDLEILTISSELALRVGIITHGMILYEMIEETELLNYLKNGAILLLVGAVVSIFEIIFAGIGIGTLLTLLGFYLTGREAKEKEKKK